MESDACDYFRCYRVFLVSPTAEAAQLAKQRKCHTTESGPRPVPGRSSARMMNGVRTLLAYPQSRSAAAHSRPNQPLCRELCRHTLSNSAPDIPRSVAFQCPNLRQCSDCVSFFPDTLVLSLLRANPVGFDATPPSIKPWDKPPSIVLEELFDSPSLLASDFGEYGELDTDVTGQSRDGKGCIRGAWSFVYQFASERR